MYSSHYRNPEIQFAEHVVKEILGKRGQIRESLDDWCLSIRYCSKNGYCSETKFNHRRENVRSQKFIETVKLLKEQVDNYEDRIAIEPYEKSFYYPGYKLTKPKTFVEELQEEIDEWLADAV